ncbi:acetyl-CoA C-acetyltransferase [Alkalihalophilus lindianensis]|uniref:acetyl-CoA C-acetyltransferase n=1 Tax=Alkalihalophilus lindianensis TaxID=1630542 RepID=A0ABU3X9J7_9BACI|nr:acetyl-CoA C-acetyltransferase [Alkalihalophilus lindianensis]MDV2684552.1 acetyl-CoA C-acetyltransferase [Alkalihalophilus lindianensis]
MKTVIVSGARTPFGKFGGALSSLKASELGGIVLKETLARANWKGENVDEVILGNVLQAGQGQIPSRQASNNAEIPWSVKTETINKVCASGMRSVTLADQIIRAGDGKVILAGGMESMSNAPYYVPKARWGARMGNVEMVDGMVFDGLTCSFRSVHMGSYGNGVADELALSREVQDEWAARSHDKALSAIDSGTFNDEIVAVPVPQRKGDPILVERDEAPRPGTTAEGLAKLRPAFGKEGTITAGNAPGVNDGAAAMLLMSDEKAKAEGIEPLATIVAHHAIAIEPENFPKTPGLVINELLNKAGKSASDIDLFEINEAFAAVALASNQIAELDPEKVNVNGGAVALGHPIGASGARIILTLAHELKRRGGGLGIAAICSGGGQGDAVLIEVK